MYIDRTLHMSAQLTIYGRESFAFQFRFPAATVSKFHLTAHCPNTDRHEDVRSFIPFLRETRGVVSEMLSDSQRD